jgi:drug/metabolite transporter (DMT)-like permease
MMRFRATALAAVFGGLIALVLLLPSRGVDSDPPECYSYFDYVVPCGLGSEQLHGAGFAVAGAVAAALFVIGGSAAGRQDRSRS